MYKRGSDLGVLGSDGTFWLCRTRQHVEQGRLNPFEIHWFEVEGPGYALTGGIETITLDTVIKKVHLSKQGKYYTLKDKDILELEEEVDNYFNPKAKDVDVKKAKDGKKVTKKGQKVVAKKVKIFAINGKEATSGKF